MLQLVNQLRGILRIYSVYRFLLSIILLSAILSKINVFTLYVSYPQTLLICCWLYLLLNIAAILLPVPSKKLQIFVISLADIGLLIVIFAAAGGIPSGIGNLLVVAVAINNILLSGSIGFALAALAASGIVYITFFLNISFYADLNYVPAAVLGILCFICAILMQALARKLKTSVNLTQTQAQDLINLSEVNQQILQRLEIGCLLLDEDLKINFANVSAIKMLGRDDYYNLPLDQVLPALYLEIILWQNNQFLESKSVIINEFTKVQPSFQHFNYGGTTHTLVFLEDLAKIAETANIIKQKALAAMAGSIAHEIRNPLSSISYSAQILIDKLKDPKNVRLLEIILSQMQRIDDIVNNIAQITKREEKFSQIFNLPEFAEQIVSEINLKDNEQIHFATCSSNLMVEFDQEQLRQIVLNLIQNGLYFSAQKNGAAQVWLNLEVDATSKLIILNVIDDGFGVEPQNANKIFEPFYSTRLDGSGLGLYVSKELCDLNAAHLMYKKDANGGSCFKILFSLKPQITSNL